MALFRGSRCLKFIKESISSKETAVNLAHPACARRWHIRRECICFYLTVVAPPRPTVDAVLLSIMNAARQSASSRVHSFPGCNAEQGALRVTFFRRIFMPNSEKRDSLCPRFTRIKRDSRCIRTSRYPL